MQSRKTGRKRDTFNLWKIIRLTDITKCKEKNFGFNYR